ncbi:MAG: phosphodiesterase [Verrucomicrobia bacterium]|nr:phosphodiesterase [Verrucomicrobiota bacterium]
MRIAQITDAHIVGKNQHWYTHETKIAERLKRVIAHLNEMDLPPDIVMLTGDATDLGEPEAYEHLRELLKPLKAPLYVIPGNHDKREAMRGAFSDASYMPKEGFLHYAIETYPVRLIALDTLVEGEGHGLMCEERISWLEKTLKAEPKKPTLIFMHHPPVRTGWKLFDKILCKADPRFEELVRENSQVVGVFTGHYHHLCISSFAGKPCILAPSIAPVHYFARPEDDEVTALELEDPAITMHEWLGGQTVTSRIVRVKEGIIRLDWARFTKK